MPSYALSAYELISREVESVYLKIPWGIGTSMLSAPIDYGDTRDSWVRRHLYVLMTRASRRLVIEVEDKGLFEHFQRVLAHAGVTPCAWGASQWHEGGSHDGPFDALAPFQLPS